MAGEALIHLEGLSKVFYTEEVETHALSNINLQIKTGEFVSIAGPSGCGKTTLLSILGLLDSPTAGKYLLDSEPVENLSASQRAKIRNQAIGFIFQAFNLIGDLTVYENVELPLTYRGMPGSEWGWRTGWGTIRASCRAASSSGWRWRGRSWESR
jgi:putative ABC transport system ATP-binding protein